jgi:hypothetical protein
MEFSVEDFEAEVQREANLRLVDVLEMVFDGTGSTLQVPKRYCQCLKCGPHLDRYARLKINYRHACKRESDSWRRMQENIFRDLERAQQVFYETPCTCPQGGRVAPRWGPNIRKRVRR